MPRNLPLNGKEEEESAFEGNKVKGGSIHHHQAGSSLLPAPPRVDGCHKQKVAGTRINTTFNQQLTVYKKRKQKWELKRGYIERQRFYGGHVGGKYTLMIDI